MLKRSDWLDAARKLDWTYSYVDEREVFPEAISGAPWLPHEAWSSWNEPFKTTFAEYVAQQSLKTADVAAAFAIVEQSEYVKTLPPAWVSAVKLHVALLPLAEFAAVIGNLRAARFGRDGAWRAAATFGALDELRHTQIPLLLMHEFVKHDEQFDWAHKFYHSNNWVAIAARHVMDEMLLTANPIEYAIAANFVFETGFTNLQFIALATLARAVGDRVFEKMLTSIQTDEARHAQIGTPVLSKIIAHDRAYAQRMLDKWFWRNWQLFAIVTGFSMDYFTPIECRTQSFKEFMHEWLIEQYLEQVKALGLKKPWYWDIFLQSLDTYHHRVYASAYTYRASVWFDFVVPSPRERAWLRDKYPSFAELEPVWNRIDERWAAADAHNDFAVHGAAIVTFCDICQVVLCGGPMGQNSATFVDRGGKKHAFCSEPCRWIFECEPDRYARHNDVVKRVLAGEAPANLIALVQRYFGLEFATWGKDTYGGRYPWVVRPRNPTESRL